MMCVCGSTLCDVDTWEDLTPGQRIHMEAAHKRLCFRARTVGNLTELGYYGGWECRGLVLVPARRGAA